MHASTRPALKSQSCAKDEERLAPLPSPKDSWVLGKRYSCDEQGRKRLGLHCQSLFRFTYRRDFPALAPYTYTSDAGWGCMIRAAQMLMGNAFKRHCLGADWRLPQSAELLRDSPDYRTILQWFMDRPGSSHMFSIQHMVAACMRYDVMPGEWWGPSTASYVLRDLCKVHRVAYGGPIAVHVSQNDSVFVSEVEGLCSNVSLNDCLLGLTEHAALANHSSLKRVNSRIDQRIRGKEGSGSAAAAAASAAAAVSESDLPTNAVDAFFDPLLRPLPSAVSPWTTALLLLVPLRLGVSGVNAQYLDAIKEFFRTEWCMGILGGKVGHAIYFTGYDGAKDVLLGLDPHTVFAAPSEADLSGDAFPGADVAGQIHVSSFVTLAPGHMDPSLSAAFYFPHRESFDAFCRHYHSVKGLVSIQHTAPTYSHDDDDYPEEDVPEWMKRFLLKNPQGGGKRAGYESEDNDWEFV